MRYILRRNPVRAKEMFEVRSSKHVSIDKFVTEKNIYLQEHPRAMVAVKIRDVGKKIKSLKSDKWLKVKVNGRALSLEQDDEVLKEGSILDGCYAMKTDLPQEVANKQTIT